MRNRLTAFDGAWSMLDRLHRDLNSAFEPARAADWGGGATNVWTSEDEATVAFELPGLDPDAVDVTVDKNLLTVRCERAEEETDAEPVLSERHHGDFTRSVRLPFEADASGVTASYERGVLLVSVPRAEQTKPARIAVTAA